MATSSPEDQLPQKVKLASIIYLVVLSLDALAIIGIGVYGYVQKKRCASLIASCICGILLLVFGSTAVLAPTYMPVLLVWFGVEVLEGGADNQVAKTSRIALCTLLIFNFALTLFIVYVFLQGYAGAVFFFYNVLFLAVVNALSTIAYATYGCWNFGWKFALRNIACSVCATVIGLVVASCVEDYRSSSDEIYAVLYAQYTAAVIACNAGINAFKTGAPSELAVSLLGDEAADEVMKRWRKICLAMFVFNAYLALMPFAYHVGDFALPA